MRPTLFPALFWILVIAGVICLVGQAKAALNYRAETPSGTVGLRLSEAPCTYEKVLVHIKPEFHSMLKAAILTYGGRDWQACYIEMDMPGPTGKVEAMIFAVDEEGAPLQALPKSIFKDDTI